ncbi:unnamed protein product, partial [Vitrella brassicaformis CCMP3155]
HSYANLMAMHCLEDGVSSMGVLMPSKSYLASSCTAHTHIDIHSGSCGGQEGERERKGQREGQGQSKGKGKGKGTGGSAAGDKVEEEQDNSNKPVSFANLRAALESGGLQVLLTPIAAELLKQLEEKEEKPTAKLAPPADSMWAGTWQGRLIQMIRMIPLPPGVKEGDEVPEVVETVSKTLRGRSG